MNERSGGGNACGPEAGDVNGPRHRAINRPTYEMRSGAHFTDGSKQPEVGSIFGPNYGKEPAKTIPERTPEENEWISNMGA